MYNPNPVSAAKAKAQFGLPVFTDLKEFLIVPGLDIVCVCTPSGMHLEPALAAAKAGKHLMIEKPIEINLQRTDELIAACSESGVKLAVIFQNRFTEDYQKLKSAVSGGVFGRLLMGNAM
ncbi:Gfo/Idh/MocA family oxidoreductase [Algoriphagus boritolerans]|uniref:Gfo/Idh/MocA family protein n=1 Tax=Algoriphagus boritolerans TaxID=308111 RepID=UPI000A6FA577